MVNEVVLYLTNIFHCRRDCFCRIYLVARILRGIVEGLLGTLFKYQQHAEKVRIF